MSETVLEVLRKKKVPEIHYQDSAPTNQDSRSYRGLRAQVRLFSFIGAVLD